MSPAEYQQLESVIANSAVADQLWWYGVVEVAGTFVFACCVLAFGVRHLILYWRLKYDDSLSGDNVLTHAAMVLICAVFGGLLFIMSVTTFVQACIAPLAYSLKRLVH